MLLSGGWARADEAQEVMIAAQHAGLAAASTYTSTLQTHLHHVVNCLEGPDGDDFDKDAGNPCEGKGKGAIPDAGDKAGPLKEALKKALEGIASISLFEAQQISRETQALLTK